MSTLTAINLVNLQQ